MIRKTLLHLDIGLDTDGPAGPPSSVVNQRVENKCVNPVSLVARSWASHIELGREEGRFHETTVTV